MPLHFNSFSNERNSSQLDVGVLTTTLYILGGGENEMVDFFFYRVIDGKRTCNPENKSLKMVPARFVDAVTEMLTAEGLDLDGKPIQG